MPSGLLIAWSRVDASATRTPASRWASTTRPASDGAGASLVPSKGTRVKAPTPSKDTAKAAPRVMFAVPASNTDGGSDERDDVDDDDDDEADAKGGSMAHTTGSSAEASGPAGVSMLSQASLRPAPVETGKGGGSQRHGMAPPPMRKTPTAVVAAASSALAPVGTGGVGFTSGVVEDDDDRKAAERSMDQSAARRALKRTLDAMTKRHSFGVVLMRRALWVTSGIFIVLAAVTMAALGPWTERIFRHVAGIRHAGHIIEQLYQSALVVEVLSTEKQLIAAGLPGWPVTSQNATQSQLRRLPAHLDASVATVYSDIQAIGGSLLALTTSSDAVTVIAESGTVVPGGGGSGGAGGGTVPGRLRRSLAASSRVTMSLFDALQAVQQSLQALSERAPGSLSSSEADVSFVRANSPRVAAVVNGTLEVKALDMARDLNEIEAIELFTFVTVIAVTVLGQLLVSVIASAHLWREQIALMRIFYQIPGKLAAALASRAELRLRKHRRQTAGIVGVGADESGLLAEDSDDSVERQREEGEEIRWQLLVERMARVAQEDWASEQAQSSGVDVQTFLLRRRNTRGSICLDAIQPPQADRRGSFAGAAGEAVSTSGGRRASKARRRSTEGRSRRGSAAGDRVGHTRRGDARIRAAMVRERRDGVKVRDSTCTRPFLLVLTLAPSLLIAAWFATIYTLDIAMHARVVEESERLVHLQQMSVWAGELAHTVSEAAFLPEARANITLQAQLAEKAAHERASIITRATLLRHGGSSRLADKVERLTGRKATALSPLAENNALLAVLARDACGAVLAGAQGTYYAEEGIVTAESCAAAHHGVLSRGLTVAVMRLLAESRAVEAALHALWGRDAELTRTLANASWAAEQGITAAQLRAQVQELDADAQSLATVVLQLYDPWTRDALTSMEEGVVAQLKAHIDDNWELQRNITIAFLVVFLLSVVGLFAPRLGWVERIVSATRRMLLVIPDDVLLGFPLLSESVRELEAALATRSSVADKLGSTAATRRAAIRQHSRAGAHASRQPPSARSEAAQTSDSHMSTGSKVAPARQEDLEGLHGMGSRRPFGASFMQSMDDTAAFSEIHSGPQGHDLTEGASPVTETMGGGRGLAGAAARDAETGPARRRGTPRQGAADVSDDDSGGSQGHNTGVDAGRLSPEPAATSANVAAAAAAAVRGEAGHLLPGGRRSHDSLDDGEDARTGNPVPPSLA